MKKLTTNEINRRRKEFAYIPFGPGVVFLGIVAVPLASFYLRTWKPIVFWIPAIVLISILPLDMGGSFVAAILINAAYAYITVKSINMSLLQSIPHDIQEPVESKKNLESDNIERIILDILEDHSPLSIGRICAYSDYPHLEVKKKIDYLKQAHVIAERINKSGTVEYYLR